MIRTGGFSLGTLHPCRAEIRLAETAFARTRAMGNIPVPTNWIPGPHATIGAGPQ